MRIKLFCKSLIVSLGIIIATLAFAQDSEPVIYLTPIDDQPSMPARAVINQNNHRKRIVETKVVETKIYGPTKPEESIWSIAAKIRPNSIVTIQQIIIALQQLNPQAFEQNNINGLKSSQNLKVPTMNQIEASNIATAAAMVMQQNQQWQQSQNSNNVVSKTSAIISPNAVKHPPVLALNDTNNVQLKQLQQQLTTAQNDLRSYEQNTDKKIDNLSQQNTTLQTQLSTVGQTINEFKEQVSNLAKVLNKKFNEEVYHRESTHYESPNSQRNNFQTQNKVFWWILCVAAFLIIVLWIPGPQKKENSPEKERQEPSVSMEAAPEVDHELKDEYDFMNSEEGVPAKLDLARAYIDMDDSGSAEQVLQEVIEKGNKTERKKAQTLLKKIKSAK